MLTFEATQELDDAAVRELLERGEPPERVWALWTTALRKEAGAAQSARTQLSREPDPGVRRHLLLVLAGLGERAVLLRFLQLDPSPYVRGTAARFLWQTAEDADRPRAAELLSERLRIDESSVVRLAILNTQGEPSGLDTRSLLTCVDDDDLETRAEAYRQLFAVGSDEVVRGLFGRILPEPSSDLRVTLVRWLHGQGHGADVLRLAAEAPDALATEIFSALDTGPGTFSWEVLAPLAVHPSRDMARQIAYWIRREDAHRAFPLFLSLWRELEPYEPTWTEDRKRESRARWDYHEQVEDLLLEGLVQLGWSPAPEPVREQLARFRDSRERAHRHWDTHFHDWSDEWPVDEDARRELEARDRAQERALQAAIGG